MHTGWLRDPMRGLLIEQSFTTRRDCFNVRVVISDTLESIKVPLML